MRRPLPQPKVELVAPKRFPVLYHLRRVDILPGSRPCDEVVEFVIRHYSPIEARVLANDHYGDEGPIWTDPSKVKCIVLEESREVGVICRNFHSS